MGVQSDTTTPTTPRQGGYSFLPSAKALKGIVAGKKIFFIGELWINFL
jgi:hypothetical protein